MTYFIDHIPGKHLLLLTSSKPFHGCSGNHCMYSVCASESYMRSMFAYIWGLCLLIYEVYVCPVNYPLLWHIHPPKWCHLWINSPQRIDGSVQDCSISTANAVEILQSGTKPSRRYVLIRKLCFWTLCILKAEQNYIILQTFSNALHVLGWKSSCFD